MGVLGVQLALTDYDETLDWIDSMIAAQARGYLCACNVHTVMASREDPELRAAFIKGQGRKDRREREPDPNSPFAKLAALKEQLEANAKARP